MNTEKLAGILHARLKGGNVTFDGVDTDTRTLQPGNLFFALKGDSHDGHGYVSDAVDRGAVAVVVDREVDCDVPQIIVTDTLIALSDYAAWHRKQLNPTVIAITGSCGKTTTRKLMQSILCTAGFNVLATHRNWNNHIGVPLMLLRLTPEHEFAVLELGANHAGEIAHLAELVQPHIGVITNAAAAHLEGFGSLAGVARAKGELYQALGTQGTAVVNADDEFYDYWNTIIPCNTVTFAKNAPANVQISYDESASSIFDMSINGNNPISVLMPLLGHHNYSNAAAAAAVSQTLGLSANAIKRGIECTEPEYGRLVEKSGKLGASIIDDSYNANPHSVKAAIDLLGTRRGSKVLVLADMLELGEKASEHHRHIGGYAREKGIDALLLFGPLSVATADGFGDGAQHFSSRSNLIEKLHEHLRENVTVLVKGSNSMKMSEVVQAVLEQ